MNLLSAAVTDLSSGAKVGYAGQNFPTSIFPSMIGRPVLRAEEVRLCIQ
jgi:actin-related protein 2